VIEIHRGADRAVTTTPGITTRHGFSSGAHYDPANLSFGPLVAHDVHSVAPGAGFERHSHRGLEIVSWVLTGTLRHEDSSGRSNTVRHGTVQHLSAGSGIDHAELNAGDDELRFVQMWLLGEPGEPAYRAEGTDIEVSGARFRILRVDGEARLPAVPFLHVFVASGAVDLSGTYLVEGDEARSADDVSPVSGSAELLIWAMAGARPRR